MSARIDEMFEALVARRGSDLHLGVGVPPLLRVRGQLTPLRVAPVEAAEMDELLDAVLDDEQQRRLAGELEIDVALALGDRSAPRARFRGNVFHDAAGRGAVFRLVPAAVPSLDDLGAPPAIRRLAERRSGLCLVTGPTGSGKSTTLAAMIRHINEVRACHVLTLEDPIEFVHEPIRAQLTQRQIGDHAPSFAAALAAAGREDADVILVGELQTPEAIKLALALAGSGALVLAAMQAGGATATLERIVGAFPAEEQPQVRGLIAECLIGVVAQHLVPGVDGAARVAAHEILLGSSALSSLVREGRTYQVPTLVQGGQAAGMQTLDQALERLVAAGKITRDVALERAADREALARALEAPAS